MSSNRQEQERIQRLRDAQIRARDPGTSKIKGYDWAKHGKRAAEIKKSRQKPLLLEVLDIMPPRWKGAAMGVALGLIPLIAAQIFLQGDWKILGLLPILVFGIVGFVIGKTTQDEIPH
ncbi:MAG: hypothetical protein U0694_07015 [Anaerolineae bacterium]